MTVRVEHSRQHPGLVIQLAETCVRVIVERRIFIDVLARDWNYPRNITPCHTAAEVEMAIAPLKQRIAELEIELKWAKRF